MESYINLDKNMLVNTTIGDAEVVWHDVRKKLFHCMVFMSLKQNLSFAGCHLMSLRKRVRLLIN